MDILLYPSRKSLILFCNWSFNSCLSLSSWVRSWMIILLCSAFESCRVWSRFRNSIWWSEINCPICSSTPLSFDPGLQQKAHYTASRHVALHPYNLMMPSFCKIHPIPSNTLLVLMGDPQFILEDLMVSLNSFLTKSNGLLVNHGINPDTKLQCLASTNCWFNCAFLLPSTNWFFCVWVAKLAS